MKQILIVLAITISSVPLCAADSTDVPWTQVCRKVSDREVLIKTATGETIQGYCVSVDVNAVSITTIDHGLVKVARNNIDRLLMFPRGHQLRSLGKGVRGGLSYGFNALLSPSAVMGAIAIPGTLAWGAVSAPFCILGDLRAKLSHSKEITIK